VNYLQYRATQATAEATDASIINDPLPVVPLPASLSQAQLEEDFQSVPLAVACQCLPLVALADKT